MIYQEIIKTKDTKQETMIKEHTEKQISKMLRTLAN